MENANDLEICQTPGCDFEADESGSCPRCNEWAREAIEDTLAPAKAMVGALNMLDRALNRSMEKGGM